MSAVKVRRPMRPGDEERLRFLHGAQLAPGGSRVVFALTSTDSGAARDRSRLMVCEIADGRCTPLTEDGGVDSAPAWSPDGRRIAFLRVTAEGTAQLHVVAAEGGSPVCLTALSGGVSGRPAWSPDGTRLGLLTPAAQPRDPAAPYRVTRSVWRVDGLGLVDDARTDVCVLDLAGGGLMRLTAGEAVHSELAWTCDGEGLLAVAAFGPGDDGRTNRLVRIDAAGGEVVTLTDGSGAIGAYVELPDGRIAFTHLMQRGRPLGARGHVYVRERDGATTCRTDGHPVGLGGKLLVDMPTGWTAGAGTLVAIDDAEGHAVLAPVQYGGTVRIERIALDGPVSWSTVVDGERACVPVGLAGRALVFTATSIDRPWELHDHDLDTGHERRLTEANDEALAAFTQPDVRRLTCASADGAAVEGWMLLPPGARLPLPTVLYVHGGPYAAFGHAFSIDMQLLAGAGYGVLLVNQRGSTGYGEAFATAISGHWGQVDVADLLSAVDAAVAAGLADPGRLGVAGRSAGGYLACWLAVHSDRFRAAVPENPLTDWFSMYATSDVGSFLCQAELGGSPQDIPEEYRRRSPLTEAHRCRTPTLLVQAEHDWRTPTVQSEAFHRALAEAGCPTEMLRLPGVPHDGSVIGPVPVRRAQNAALVEWMDRWLLSVPGEG